MTEISTQMPMLWGDIMFRMAQISSKGSHLDEELVYLDEKVLYLKCQDGDDSSLDICPHVLLPLFPHSLPLGFKVPLQPIRHLCSS